MSQDDDQTGNGLTRKELIEQAQRECHYARAECQEANARYGEVPESYRLYFQSMIANYYWSIRPMREESAVNDWWDEVALSDYWADPETGDPFTGLENIATVNRLTKTIPVKEHTVRGSKDDVKKQPLALPFEILEDISGVLDDAAARLGFAPTAPKHRKRFHIPAGGDEREYPEPWGEAKKPTS